MIAQTRFARIAQLEEAIEQELCTLAALAGDSSPLRKSLGAFTASLNTLSAARTAAQNATLPAAIAAKGGAR